MADEPGETSERWGPLVWAAIWFVANMTLFGLIMTVLDDEPVTARNIVGRGLFFGIAMTVVMAVDRRWTARRRDR